MKMRFIEKTGTLRQFVYLCAFSILTLLIASYIIFHSHSQSILDSTTDHIDNVALQFQNEFSGYMDEIDQVVNSLAINPTIKEYLTGPSDYRRHLIASELVDYFRSLTSLKSAIKDISVLRTDGGKISYYNYVGIQPQLLERLADKPYAYSLGIQEYGKTKEHLLLVGCAIRDTDIMYAETNPQLGTVVITVDPRVLGQKLDVISGMEDVYYMVYDSNGAVIIGNLDEDDQQMLDLAKYANKKDEIFETGKYRVKAARIIKPEGTIVTIVDKEVLQAPVRKALQFNVGIILCATIVLVVMYFIASSSVIRPIGNIINFLQAMKHDYIGHMNQRIRVEGNYDTILLSQEFNHMLGEISSLTHQLVENNTRLYETKLAQKQSEIALLRSQINPHFLYNTLEIIRSLAVVDNTAQIKKTVNALAKIMRYSIKGYDNVHLADEMSIVKDYIDIQGVRFKDRFEALFSIQEEALDCIVPKMCLQPIVENAFVHGIEHLPKGGMLRIEAKKQDEKTLIVTVEDNGPGLESQELEKLNHQLKSNLYTPYSPQMAGLGLLNVNSRIRLMHQQGNYGMTIFSGSREGTCVKLVFYVGEDVQDV